MKRLLIILMIALTANAKLRSDLDGDHRVTLKDFNILARSWGYRLSAGAITLTADCNGDGLIDVQDLAIMANEWLQREPDYQIKIATLEGRRGLTMREKQMLRMARKKYLIRILTD